MTDLVAGEEFQQLFREFTSTAFRLENQGVYGEPAEAEPLRRFLAGHNRMIDGSSPGWTMFAKPPRKVGSSNGCGCSRSH